LQLILAADERRRLHRKIRLVQALERRKRIVAELVDPLGRAQVLQPVLAEIAQRIRAAQIARRLRDEDLTAVACGSDASGAVHVDADVALVSKEWLTGVKADPNANRAGGERVARHSGGGERIRRLGKGNEESITLRVHLDTAMAGEGLAESAAVVAQNVRIPIAELVQQPCRALHIGEQERDGAGGKLGHRSMMRRLL
jgi:hypothetical protein